MKKILGFTSVLAIIAGTIMIIGGLWGIVFTYKNVARENITTPDDASIPSSPVRGPLTLHSQAEIIREHVLHTTNGLMYSEMPQKIAKLDQAGNAILDENGEPVMVSNDARSIWITATTLITALHLGIITYVFSGLIVLLGLISIWTGIIFRILKKRFFPASAN
jgi:hypothetical protein